MTPEQFRDLEELVAGAVLVRPEERGAWMRQRCLDLEVLREAESMLEAEPPAEFLESSQEGRAVAALLPAAGETVGRWKLVRPLGRGGMATVYLATHLDSRPERQAAIKIVETAQPAELEKRFRQESEILSQLHHPNIVRLLEVGQEQDAWPWMALEYVKGRNCAQWAAENRHNRRAILNVFLEICGAIQFAHAKLVVHRDLKPSNILISADAQPHILDFGVARLLEPFGLERTKTGYRAFTLHYASPGQILGQPASTADDIYALGVLLYEMLGGQVPYLLSGVSLPELIRFAQGGDVVPMQPLAGVDADLRAVVGKAIARDGAARYHSVEAVAEDLRRYLDGYPVEARGPGLGYRVRKLVGRHKLMLAGGTAAILLASAAGVRITRDAEQARLAAVEAERQRQLSDAALRREAEALRQVSQKAEEAAKSRAAAIERFNDVRSLASALLDTLEPEARRIPGAGKFRQVLAEQAALYLDRLGKSLRGNRKTRRSGARSQRHGTRSR